MKKSLALKGESLLRRGGHGALEPVGLPPFGQAFLGGLVPRLADRLKLVPIGWPWIKKADAANLLGGLKMVKPILRLSSRQSNLAVFILVGIRIHQPLVR